MLRLPPDPELFGRLLAGSANRARVTYADRSPSARRRRPDADRPTAATAMPEATPLPAAPTGQVRLAEAPARCRTARPAGKGEGCAEQARPTGRRAPSSCCWAPFSSPSCAFRGTPACRASPAERPSTGLRPAIRCPRQLKVGRTQETTFQCPPPPRWPRTPTRSRRSGAAPVPNVRRRSSRAVPISRRPPQPKCPPSAGQRNRGPHGGPRTARIPPPRHHLRVSAY